jgi:nitrogenase iron protein NifH
VQQAEVNQQTVIEYSPDSAQAEVYRSLAGRVMENTRLSIPTPLETDELESLAREFI